MREHLRQETGEQSFKLPNTSLATPYMLKVREATPYKTTRQLLFKHSLRLFASLFIVTLFSAALAHRFYWNPDSMTLETAFVFDTLPLSSFVIGELEVGETDFLQMTIPQSSEAIIALLAPRACPQIFCLSCGSLPRHYPKPSKHPLQFLKATNLLKSPTNGNPTRITSSPRGLGQTCAWHWTKQIIILLFTPVNKLVITSLLKSDVTRLAATKKALMHLPDSCAVKRWRHHDNLFC
jgi:hypothetical protein